MLREIIDGYDINYIKLPSGFKYLAYLIYTIGIASIFAFTVASFLVAVEAPDCLGITQLDPIGQLAVMALPLAAGIFSYRMCRRFAHRVHTSALADTYLSS